jgi:hypothetical protein
MELFEIGCGYVDILRLEILSGTGLLKKLWWKGIKEGLESLTYIGNFLFKSDF